MEFRKTERSLPGADALLRGLTTASAVLILVLLGLLLIVLISAALPAMREFGVGFITGTEWRPNTLERPLRDAAGKIVFEDGEAVIETIPPVFGALPTIWGTAVSSAIALLVAVPFSFGAAMFLVRLAPRWLVAPVSFLVEFLAAIPSIAYGIWGLFVLAPFLQSVVEPAIANVLVRIPVLKYLVLEQVGTDPTTGEPTMVMRALTGRDMLCGGLILAIMIIPIITAIARDVLNSVPRAQIEGTQALGATWWQSCREMLLYSRSALFGAVMLGLARAAGETMAVTMVIGNANQISLSPFEPAQTMASLLANEFAEAKDIHVSALAAVALILLIMSLAFNIIARYLVVGKDSRGAAAH
jgi:phosphate transport system permease protein